MHPKHLHVAFSFISFAVVFNFMVYNGNVGYGVAPRPYAMFYRFVEMVVDMFTKGLGRRKCRKIKKDVWIG